jgi:hypothetical protein
LNTAADSKITAQAVGGQAKDLPSPYAARLVLRGLKELTSPHCKIALTFARRFTSNKQDNTS